ncbi:MAG: MBL fold metallo-hydrolase, partial [Nitrososphaerota archaeon]
MRISKLVYMIGDGGRGLSHDLDCCVYVVDCNGSFVVIDSGVGLGNELLVNNLREDGISLDKLRYLVVTHAHSDHACGARFFQ